MVSEFHIPLLAKFATLIKHIHIAFQIILGFAHRIVEPGTDNKFLTYRCCIFYGVLPAIAEIILLTIPVFFAHYGMATAHF